MKTEKKGEDTDVVEFLVRHNHLVCIEDMPFLYVYVYHGKNTWNFNHFSKIFRASQELTGYSDIIENMLDGIYSHEESAELLNSIPFNAIAADSIKNKEVVPEIIG